MDFGVRISEKQTTLRERVVSGWPNERERRTIIKHTNLAYLL